MQEKFQVCVHLVMNEEFFDTKGFSQKEFITNQYSL